MKTSKEVEEANKALSERIDFINLHRERQIGNANQLLIGMFLKGEHYVTICNDINTYFDRQIKESTDMYHKIIAQLNKEE